MSHPSFSLPVRVYYEDTDAAGVVYYASYLRFLERARTECLREMGYEQHRLAAEETAFAVRSISAEYLKPARLDELLEVVTRIGPLGRAQVVFVQRVERNGEVLLEATVRVACFNPRRGKAKAMPKDIHEKFKALT